MMPDLQVFSNYMSLKGVGPNTHVILYSRENIQWATRVWWMLKSVNFLNITKFLTKEKVKAIEVVQNIIN